MSKKNYNPSTRKRSWFLTIPARDSECSCEEGKHNCCFSVEMLHKALEGMGYTGQLEKGQNGYLHFQIFINQDNQISFETLRNKFAKLSSKGIEIEEPRDKFSCQKYCLKSESRVGAPFRSEKYKEIAEPKEKLSLELLRAKMIEDGMSLPEIIITYPVTTNMIKALEYLDSSLKEMKARERRKDFRPLKVHYIFGKPGVGKSHLVYSSVPRDDLYVASDRNIWDNYSAQKVVLIDEFMDYRVPLPELLNYLDAYTPTLSARYHNKMGIYDEVYLLSNVPLDKQYINAPAEQFNALLRRITSYEQMDESRQLIPVPKPVRATS
ncbi:hypothetical protein ACUH88_07820 [Dermabacteraceae bacterium P13095]